MHNFIVLIINVQFLAILCYIVIFAASSVFFSFYLHITRICKLSISFYFFSRDFRIDAILLPCETCSNFPMRFKFIRQSLVPNFLQVKMKLVNFELNFLDPKYRIL